MARVDQSRVRSGYDVEALLGERYLQMILATAQDGGTIPSELELDNRTIAIAMLDETARMYEATPASNGDLRTSSADAFQTEILFGHPLGANVRIRAMPVLLGPVAFDLFVEVKLEKQFDEEGGLASVGMSLHVVDIASPIMDIILDQAGPDGGPPMPIEEFLAIVQEKIDRTIDLGSASKFKRVEDIDITWHEADVDHPACLGVYVNVRMRNGDPDEDFLPRRGDLVQARNFLPEGEDIAMASRPGIYADMAKHVFCSTAIEISPGNFDHALRKSLLNPNSERIGDLHDVDVLRIPPTGGSFPVPQNGLRIQVHGDYRDPIDLTNTDLTMTVDLRPKTASDGSLDWDTDFNVDLDAVFEFTTLWAAAFLGILFGPGAALIFLGAIFAVEIGVGIGISLYKEGRVQEKADATLTDVIPDRLTIATRRWDPFYATLHQVVTKASQAEFNDRGFMLCGKAFIGRQLLPPNNTYIRDEMRDASGAITGMRYLIADFEKVLEDTKLLAPGTHRRSFAMPTEAEPELWPLTLQEFKDRLEDPDGPLVLARIPYFQAYVYIRGNQIDQFLCISGTEVEDLQSLIREEARQRGYDRIKLQEGDAITQDVMADLGPDATEEEIEAEVDKRINKKLKKVMDGYRSPSPLRLSRDGSMEPLLRFDLAPEEFIMLQDKKIVVADQGKLRSIHGDEVLNYLRDIPGGDEEEDDDNLLARPRYKPTPEGPVFR